MGSLGQPIGRCTGDQRIFGAAQSAARWIFRRRCTHISNRTSNRLSDNISREFAGRCSKSFDLWSVGNAEQFAVDGANARHAGAEFSQLQFNSFAWKWRVA
jgi:hypothetical protein